MRLSLSPEQSRFFHGWLFFLLEEHDGQIKLVLQRTRPLQNLEDTVDVMSVLGVQTEEVGPPTPPASMATAIDSPSDTNHADAVEIWDQVLGSFYNVPLRIPLQDIAATLSTSEQLVTTATNLGCLDLLSAPISTALQSHRHTLYAAISRDPARFLLLSLSLKDSNIYTESLIHIIGAHPCWPWPTKRSSLPPFIHQLILTKASALDNLCHETERDLLLLTITVPTGPVQPHLPSQFDTWFTVQTFRDTLAQQIHALDCDRKKSLKRGTLFRKMRKGEYMPYEEMRRLMARVMPSAVEGLEEDLGLLKECARGIVEEVCVDEGMVDGEREGVGWLTCVKIGREDIPW
jgi:hypothetical protein